MTLLKNALLLPAAVALAVGTVLAIILLLPPYEEPKAPEDRPRAEDALAPVASDAHAPKTSEPAPLPAAAAQRLEQLRSPRSAPPRDQAPQPASSARPSSATQAPATSNPGGFAGARAGRPPGDALLPAQPAATHVVKRGDTPATIARQYLGDAARWPEIAQANPGLDARSLQIGQVLRLPETAAQAQPQGDVPSKGKAMVHRVGPGDTLYRLAAKYYGDSTRWKLIQDANPGLPDGGVKGLKLGTELVIPAAPEQGR